VVAGGTIITRASAALGFQRITFFAAMTAATIAPSSAQKVQMPLIDIDCAAYERRDDGKWTVLYSNKVVLGSNVNRAIVPADDPQAVRLTPGSSLDGVLNAICGRLKK
jgi:hypothetical protein